MNRGGSLRFDAIKQFRSAGNDCSSRKPGHENPEMPRAIVLSNLRKYYNLAKKPLRYDATMQNERSTHLNSTNDLLE